MIRLLLVLRAGSGRGGLRSRFLAVGRFWVLLSFVLVSSSQTTLGDTACARLGLQEEGSVDEDAGHSQCHQVCCAAARTATVSMPDTAVRAHNASPGSSQSQLPDGNHSKSFKSNGELRTSTWSASPLPNLTCERQWRLACAGASAPPPTARARPPSLSFSSFEPVLPLFPFPLSSQDPL